MRIDNEIATSNQARSQDFDSLPLIQDKILYEGERGEGAPAKLKIEEATPWVPFLATCLLQTQYY